MILSFEMECPKYNALFVVKKSSKYYGRVLVLKPGKYVLNFYIHYFLTVGISSNVLTL